MRRLYDLIDHLTSNVLLPACGFGLAIFVGWLIPERVLAEELGAWAFRARAPALAAALSGADRDRRGDDSAVPLA